jgi:gamma-glutamyltranspeptidase/glutathione hydrolase
MYLDAQGNVTEKSRIGHLASGVPGAVAGMLAAHQRLGRLPLAQVINPAIVLARNGFVLDGHRARSLRSAARRLSQFPASARQFLPNGTEGPPDGYLLRQPDLARTLEGPRQGRLLWRLGGRLHCSRDAARRRPHHHGRPGGV